MFTKNTTSRVRKKEATAVNNYAVAIKQLRILKYLVSNSAYCKKNLSNQFFATMHIAQGFANKKHPNCKNIFTNRCLFFG
jgi:hypothetical protein